MIKNILLILLLVCGLSFKKDSHANLEILGKDSAVHKKSPSGSLPISEPKMTIEQRFKNDNKDLLQILKEKNYNQFATYIHPKKGISFSMYAPINATNDKNFTKEEFVKYSDSNIKFTWGKKDGTGDYLVLSIKDYLQNWLYKQDFSASDYHFNDFKGAGNSLNNLKEIYPNSNFTENYIQGTEEFGGLDWYSVRFVFEEFEGKNYLVAVINDQWTI